jgi:hypothetical protein
VCYGAARRFWDHWDETEHDDPYRRAALFRRSVVGCEAIDAADVRAWRLGYGAWLEGCVLEASGMTDSEADETDEWQKPADFEAPDHSLMASGDQPSPAVDLSEYRESDRVESLHQKGYTYESMNRLLIPEIGTLTEGVERANRRREKERDD